MEIPFSCYIDVIGHHCYLTPEPGPIGVSGTIEYDDEFCRFDAFEVYIFDRAVPVGVSEGFKQAVSGQEFEAIRIGSGGSDYEE